LPVEGDLGVNRRPNSAVSSIVIDEHRRRGRGQGRGTCLPKIREKYFSGNYYVKFGHFVNFSFIFS